MTVVGFVIFALKCFNFLAWPVCSLGYPLCASISAIESNSSKDIQNLVTYWVSFSLISVFDHAFATLLYWNPLWPYMKLLAICWLVMHHFDGSLYVYEHIVHPCVSETPELVMNWFSARKEIFLSKAAERYIEENGVTEALQKIITNKSKSAKPKFDIKEFKAVDAIDKNTERPEYKEPSIAQKEIKKVEVTQKKEVAAAKWSGEINFGTTGIKVMTDSETCGASAAAEQVNHAEPNLSLRDINISSKEDKEIATRATSGESEFRDSLSPKVQREWSCTLCQVTVQSKTSLNDHLRGWRHKTNMEEFRACKGGNSKNQNMKKTRVENQYGAIWCDKCEIWCSGAVSMISHLTGKKHLERLQELSAVTLSATPSV